MTGNTFLYKGNESQIFEEAEVEELLANGWHDNPSDAKAYEAGDLAPTGEDKTNAPVTATAPTPVTVEVPEAPKKRGPKSKLSLKPSTTEG